MGKKSDLTVQQQESITIKTCVAASHRERKKRFQPQFAKINERQLTQTHQQVLQTPLAAGCQICARCKAFREVARIKKCLRISHHDTKTRGVNEQKDA